MDMFFSGKVHKKMDLDHLDEQMMNSKGQFLLRLNQEDFDAKEFNFYKKQIKSKDVSIQPTQERSVNLRTLIHDHIVAKKKSKLEEAKELKDKNRLQQIETSRNGMSDQSMVNKDTYGPGNIAEIVAHAMERHPEVFKTSYINQHRKKLRKNSLIFNEEQLDQQYSQVYVDKVNRMTKGFLTHRTKTFITSSLERIEQDMKKLDKRPHSVCQARHPKQIKTKMAPHEPAYFSSTTSIVTSIAKPRPDKNKVKINSAVMTWVSGKGN